MAGAQQWLGAEPVPKRAERLANLLANGPLHLRWTEIDGPVVREPRRKGFGRRIMQQMITQLKDQMLFDWRAERLVCEFSLRV